MSFDPEHYTRAYFLCRASGLPHGQCTAIPIDTYITPQSQTASRNKADVVAAIDCMAAHLSDEKCQYFFKKMYDEWNYQMPPPTTTAKAMDFGRKLVGKLVSGGKAQ